MAYQKHELGILKEEVEKERGLLLKRDKIFNYEAQKNPPLPIKHDLESSIQIGKALS